MIVKLLTEHHLECLSLKGGCTGSSESVHVKMLHCLKSHVTALLFTGSTVSFFIKIVALMCVYSSVYIYICMYLLAI